MESLHHRGSRDPTPPSPKLHPAETANQDDDDEAAQLLFQPHPRPESSTDSANLREELLCEGDSGRHDFALPPYLYTVVLLFILVLVTGFGSSLLNTPEVRLLEMALCRDFYRVHDPSIIGAPPLSYVDEERCKVDSVQVELAYVVATRSLLSAIPGIILTFPYGRLTSKIGRKPVLLLGLLGEMLGYFWIVIVCYYHQIFPTRLILLSPVFTIIGGGSKVISACINMIITDATPDHMRTTIFYLIVATMSLSAVVAMPVGSYLLSKDLWLPYKVNTVILLLPFPLIIAMPETMRNSSTIDSDIEEGDCSDDDESSLIRRIVSTTVQLAQSTKQSLAALGSSTVPQGIYIGLLLLFLVMFCSMTGRILVQYASKLLGWSISDVGYILGIRGSVSLVLLYCLAIITRFLKNRDTIQPYLLDVCVVRFSFLVLAVGTAFIAMSTSPGLFISGTILTALACGLAPAIQGLLAHFTDKSSTADVFAGAALVELLAEFIGGFSFAGLLDLGMRRRNLIGIGLPFYVSAALTFLAGSLSLFLPKA